MTSRLPRLLIALALLWTGWLHFALFTGLQSGLLDRGMLELLQHETPRLLSWTGRVHPPLYSVFLAAARWGQGEWNVDAAWLVFLHGAVVHVALVALVAWAAWRWFGPPAGAAAAWLLAFGTESMRPFEHYPISALATTAASIAMVGLARSATGRRAFAAGALAFLTVMLHLSPWFLLGPLAVTLWVAFPPARRTLVIAAAGTLVAFLATTYPGLYRQLADGGEGGGEPGTMTVGWMNGWLLLPVALTLLRSDERQTALPLAVAIGAYTLITFALQLAQIADGQPYPSSLHYFALVEPVVVLAGVGGLVGGWEHPRYARVVRLAALLVVGTQLDRWSDAMTWLWRQQHGMWTQALQPWNWL